MKSFQTVSRLPRKVNGRWLFRQVWIFNEFVSAIASLVAALRHLYQLYAYYNEWKSLASRSRAYPFARLVMIYEILGFFTFLGAFSLHTKETYWTEKADYFSAFLGIGFMAMSSIIRVFHTPPSYWALLCGVYFTASLYHIHYMLMVKFDYGYHVLVCGALLTLHIISWLIFAFRKENRQLRTEIVCYHAFVLIGVLFEVFDFPPWNGLIDAHAVYHIWFSILPYWWHRILVKDLHLSAQKES